MIIECKSNNRKWIFIRILNKTDRLILCQPLMNYRQSLFIDDILVQRRDEGIDIKISTLAIVNTYISIAVYFTFIASYSVHV